MAPNIVLHNTITKNTRMMKNQENSANYLSNHLAKFLQKRFNL